MTTILELNNLAENITVKSIIRNKGEEPRCIVSCSIHGDGEVWGNPWIPLLKSIKSGAGCPKCSGNYIQTKQEAKKEIQNIFKGTKLRIHSIIKYKNKSSECIVSCKEHGKGINWENPWTPKISGIKSGNGCPKCSGNYIPTQNEIFNELNKNILADKPYKVSSFIDYSNNKTRCNMVCDIHGNANLWENPWTPTIDKLKAGKGCPKCSECYKYTEKEIFNELNNDLLSNESYKVLSFNDYQNNKSTCNMVCDIHGECNDWDNPWTPTINHLKRGTGCPKCAIEKHSLNQVLSRLEHFNNDRYLYFIKLDHNNKSYFKIGLGSNENINRRYKTKALNDHEIELTLIENIKLPNIVALVTEYYILTHFKDNKKYFKKLKDSKINGATECFDIDILDDKSLDFFVNQAISNFKNIIKDPYFKLSKNKISKILKHFKNTIN